MDGNTKQITVAALTLGCKVNQYETDGMLELLKDAGFEIVDFNEKADIYIINTCSVTNMADRKSRQMLHRAKKKNAEAIIVAAGCYVQASKDEIEKEGTVDLLIGNNQKKEIVSVLKQYMETKERKNQVLEIAKEKEYEEIWVTQPTEQKRAFIKVQDGCNQFCSYCIIPYTRGRVRSRKKEQVVLEVEKLAAKGIKEVVLTGIHLSSYGTDLGNTDLLDLIQEITKIQGLERIRLGSLEPRIITKEFLVALKDNKKFCPHFHLSLQSACNDTLKRMNRKYTIEEYKEKCQMIRNYFHMPAITTDVIVGFPGETQEEFAVTYENLTELNLYEIHVFKFSVRKGTVAEKMPNQVLEQEKNKRSEILLDLTKKQKHQYEQAYLGKEVEVLVEEKVTIDGKEYYRGHTKQYIDVYFQWEKDVVNEIINVVYEGDKKNN